MSTRPIRCAIYTRKSTEEGLEQNFNSLDAQREACAAYIQSQAGENWIPLPGLYDDGGYSGGTLERPALQMLLDEVDRGQVDVIVVYKIDRLTRSLTDFAKLVERFDARNVSFVSVTQAFNTTTSMGRLTLNVLLSFAQFEREVTAERIRDKILASRKKGIFMGGHPPLGYDVGNRKLEINKEEAEQVRYIFKRYLELDSLGKLRADLEEKGLTTKTWVSSRGNVVGGQNWYIGSLQPFLRNRVYVGDAVHKGTAYPGEHEPILSRDLFDEVQARLEKNRIAYKKRTSVGSKGLLTGLIFDQNGYAMSPKPSRGAKGQWYLYYVSQAYLQRKEREDPGIRAIPARIIEGLVVDRLRRLVNLGTSGETSSNSLASWDRKAASQYIRQLIEKIEVAEGRIRLTLLSDGLTKTTGLKHITTFTKRGRQVLSEADLIEQHEESLVVTINEPVHRSGRSKPTTTWDEQTTAPNSTRLNRTLIKSLVKAHVWRDAIESGEIKTITDLARMAGMERRHAQQTLLLAFLPPRIQGEILRGRVPPNLTVGDLCHSNETIHWNAKPLQVNMPDCIAITK